MFHLQISSNVLALACWELQPEYGKHPMICYSNVESQMNFFFKTITILRLRYNLFFFFTKQISKKEGGRWEVEAHIGAFPNIFIDFGG